LCRFPAKIARYWRDGVTMRTRRQMIAASLHTLAAVTVWPSTALSGPLGLDRESRKFARQMFDEYVALYNQGDPAFGRFFTEDIVLETSPMIIGRQAVIDYVVALRHCLAETVRIERFAAVGEETCTAQMLTQMTCTRDLPVTAFEGLFGQAVRAGQVLRHRSVVTYGIREGRFMFIRGGPPIEATGWTWPTQLRLRSS